MTSLTRGRTIAPSVAAPHPRVAERRRHVQRSRRRRNVPLILLLIVTVVLIAGILIAASPLLAVDRITVSGADRTGAATVRIASHFSVGDALLGIDSEAATRRIEALPWVASASIDRHRSGTVDITVIERVPVAVAGGGRGRMLIDRDGHILAVAPPETALPSIGGLRPADVVGGVVRDKQQHLAEILATMPTSVRDDLLTLEGHGAELRAVRTDGIVIELGDDTAMRAKVDAVDAVLGHYGADEVAIIDVRVPDAATVTTTLRVGT